MREFLLNSPEQLDREALAFIMQGKDYGLLPCSWVRYNSRVKLAFFPDGLRTLAECLPAMDLSRTRGTAKQILTRVIELEKSGEVFLENVIWDPESIYLTDKNEIQFICLPALMPPESLDTEIYRKRIYSLVEDMISSKEGGSDAVRQMNFQKERAFGNWRLLRDSIDRVEPEEDQSITLRGINTPYPVTFRIHHELFKIGKDLGDADGLILGAESISDLHAQIGWNDICFFVEDLGSEGGTFVNDQQLEPNVEVPIGQGTVLRFAEYTFNVE